MRFVGKLAEGKRVYVVRDRVIAFAVYARKPRNGEPWRLVATVEDKMHADQRHRVNGSYVPIGRDATPREIAEVHAEWWQSIGGSEAQIVAVAPVRARAEASS